MTRNFNRSGIFNFFELSEEMQKEVINDFNFEESDAHGTSYVISKFKDEKTALPLSMFMRTDKNNFTHAIYGESYFSAYYLTLSRCNTEAVIAYKYF
jgi:hypothetical protein